MFMRKIGVVGAGTMGRGVAEIFASNGYSVTLVDCSESALENAKKEIYNIMRFRYLRRKNRLDITLEQAVNGIIYTNNLNMLNDVDYVIENTNEDINKKENCFRELDNICKKDVIFAANTSCISITRLGGQTERADKILGIHFMNPVGDIDAVEVIKGYHTSDETLNSSIELLKNVGKEAIVVNDYPGFVSNRISHLMMNEAACIVQEGVASAKDVDEIFKKCYGHKMGPLQTADLIGIDTVVDSLDVLFNSYKDSKFRCCPLLRKMRDAGLLGRKSGEGFYQY